MPKIILTLLAAISFLVSAALEFNVVTDWPRLPAGRAAIGDMHGDVAVSSAGEVYLSVQDPEAGLQVYAPDGTFLRNVPGAPADFHGFVIRRQGDSEFIFGARLRDQSIVKIALDGRVVLTIPASSVPDEFKNTNQRTGQRTMALTGIDVAPNGDLYVTDGYASDYIHRFSRTGQYLKSFGGKQAPYNFNTLHKIAIDTRFQPARIIGCDRANNRLVHVSLDGEFLGVVAKDLLLPAAVAIHGDHAVVGELNGRITILDKAGRSVAQLGANTESGIGSNGVPPEKWRPGFVISPHGVALNERGDLWVSEYSKFGRVQRFNRQ
jgi:hypothetical protein